MSGEQAGVITWASDIALVLSFVVLVTGLLQHVWHLLQLVMAGVALVRRPPVRRAYELWLEVEDRARPVSVLIPAFNEELTIVESVRSILGLNYPQHYVIVINDGSTDRTLDRLIANFDLYPVLRAYPDDIRHKPIRASYASRHTPHLIVVDKENGGKADALNAGIAVARTPYVCAVDADSLLEPDSLLRAMRPFIDDPKRVVATGGTVRIANGCDVEGGRVTNVRLPRAFLPLLQTMEYLRAFLIARLGSSLMGASTIVSGAFGVFKRQVLVEVGGFDTHTVGEDMEIIVRIHRRMLEMKRPYSVEFVPEPVCWTMAPETLGSLARQRIRWHRGSLEVFFKHSAMTLNPKYGRVGLVAFSSVLVIDVLGPLIEAIGYLLVPFFWVAGFLSVDFLLAYLAVTFAIGIFLSVGSLILEELELRRFQRAHDLAVLLGVAILENFGYRQLNTLWRVAAMTRFLRRSKRSWGRQTRKEFGTTS